MSHKDCDFCRLSNRVRRTQSSGSRAKLIKLATELMDKFCQADFDRDYANAILDGSWPQAVEILERSLIKARAKQGQPVKRRLYLDADGVLADFDASVLDHFGMTFPALKERCGYEKAWEGIQQIRGFYRRLPLMSGSRELYEAVKHLDPAILTGCHEGGFSESDKVQWAEEHFPGVRIITCLSEHKHHFIFNPGDVLVDDRLRYRHLWEGAGGIFIHYQNADQTIAEVLQLFGEKA